MPTLAPGNRPFLRRRAGRSAPRGFTLIELMVVVALIAIASAVVSLALRDPAATRLDHEAARLVALLEAARTEARASGLPASWEPRPAQADAEGFRFVGLPSGSELPNHWLNPGVSAEVVNARALVLGPEPLIGAQRIVLRLDDQRVTLATDGLGPFVVADEPAPAAR
ncbi:MAG: prepilin-type N-terminal cleavage/methylation domain-containing protein [Burkholderiaceae bacterium]